MPAAAAVGIDFGSSHTVAMLRRGDGRVEPLVFDASPLLPSAVFADGDSGILVGRDALYAARTAPQCLEPHPKRRIDDGTVLLGRRELPVVDLFAAVLERVRRECVQVGGGMPTEVVVTHPAGWGPRRRLVLSGACERAGWPTVRLVPEPVAAATYLTEHLHHDVDGDGAVVVHDFGGGTFDAAVVARRAGRFEVLSVDGLDHLGGIDIDAAIVENLRERVGGRADWDALLSPDTPERRRAWRGFTEDVRVVKEQLSRRSTADLHVPVVDRDVHITRAEVEESARPLVSQAIDVVNAVITDAGIGETPELFLVGGASRMPLVATLLHRRLGRAPIVADQLEQIVAHGAILTATDASPSTRDSLSPAVPADGFSSARPPAGHAAETEPLAPADRGGEALAATTPEQHPNRRPAPPDPTTEADGTETPGSRQNSGWTDTDDAESAEPHHDPARPIASESSPSTEDIDRTISEPHENTDHPTIPEPQVSTQVVDTESAEPHHGPALPIASDPQSSTKAVDAGAAEPHRDPDRPAKPEPDPSTEVVDAEAGARRARTFDVRNFVTGLVFLVLAVPLTALSFMGVPVTSIGPVLSFIALSVLIFSPCVWYGMTLILLATRPRTSVTLRNRYSLWLAIVVCVVTCTAFLVQIDWAHFG